MTGPIDWDAEVIGPCIDVFGEPVTYLPAAGGSFAITGVFDREFQELELIDAEVGNQTRRPVLGVQLAQLPAEPGQNDQVVIRGHTYVVRESRPDGHGYAKLMLQKQRTA